MTPVWAVALVQGPEREVPAQELEPERVPVAQVQGRARAPGHRPAVQVQEQALEPVPVRAAQVRERVLALVPPALRRTPTQEQAQELAEGPAVIVAPEEEVAVEALEPRAEVLAVPPARQREPLAAEPQAMAAPEVARLHQEARQQAAASPDFGDVYLAALRTMSPRRLLLLRREELALPKMRCMH
jgi:hypothetical protein